MQFQVPQFIETEDKIVGPFSLRQFAYVGAGGVLSAFLYFVAEPWLWVIGSFFIFAIAFGFAFVKIEGRPLMNVAISAFHFYWKPQTYVWQPEATKIVVPPKKEIAAEAGKSALEDILAKSAAKVAKMKAAAIHPAALSKPATAKPAPATLTQPPAQLKPVSRETVSTGSALHKNWEDVQTGSAFAKKNSDKQFLDKKMAERYQIFNRMAGDRTAAKRVDYR